MTLAEIIKDSFSLKEQDQNDSVVLNSLEEWESMAHMLFITRVEESYGIEFTGEDILNMQTIGDIKKVLSEKGAAVV
ncbi:MAG: acyl carrier protein [Flavipsychrobacter sp.]|jgi:acyl carrier protein|nr:acyl carrier protein [Flavipsychrobacter sp.]